MMDKETYQLWARKAAVLTHDRNSAWFEEQYKSSLNYLDSAFLYGRWQINRHFQRLVSQLPEGAKVLDVGCGTGEQILQLQQRGFQVVGVEPSEQMRKYAESKLFGGTVQNASVFDLPFTEGTFDFVYAIEVFRYLNSDDNLAGLREIRRVLKGGGTFFGTFVNLFALDGCLLRVSLRKLINQLLGKNVKCHAEMTTPRKLRKLFLSAGFSQVEIHGVMIAPLRIIYELSPKLGSKCARILAPIDPILSDAPLLRAFAGHCLAWAKK